MSTEIEKNQININGFEATVPNSPEFDELLKRPDMRIGFCIIVVNGEGEFGMSEGSRLPLVIVGMPENQAIKHNEAISRIAILERRIKEGFAESFANTHKTASELLRFCFNVKEGQDPYVDQLVKIFTRNPKLCLQITHSYRADGRQKNGEMKYNEVNANPGGIHWVSEIGRIARSKNYNPFAADEIEDRVVEFIVGRLNAKEGGVFFPTERLSAYKVLPEMLAIGNKLRMKFGIDYAVGEVRALQIESDGEVYVQFPKKRIRIAFVDGVSSPTTFRDHPLLLEMVANGKLDCPSLGATTVSITNKGMYALITAMREAKIDPGLLKITTEELKKLSEPIPDTYWVEDPEDNSINPDALRLVKNRTAVLKPFDGAGGDSVILDPTVDDLYTHRGKRFLAQEILEPYNTAILRNYGSNPIVHKGSIDPYFSYTLSGEPLVLGFISRGSQPGSVSNVSAHSEEKTLDDTLPNHLGLIVKK